MGSNWKLFIDAFMEFYHAPVLHSKQAAPEESRKLQGFGYEALAYDVDGPHAMVSSWGGMSPPKDLAMVKPWSGSCAAACSACGRGRTSASCPPASTPPAPVWGTDSFLFFPNFMVLIWKPNWYITYHYWPTSYNTHIFETSLYFVPPTTPSSASRRSWPSVTFKEYGLQDGNTLEATQTMIESRAVTEFPCATRRSCSGTCTDVPRHVADHRARQPA